MSRNIIGSSQLLSEDTLSMHVSGQVRMRGFEIVVGRFLVESNEFPNSMKIASLSFS